MKNSKDESWPNEFNFENLETNRLFELSEEIGDDSYEALNRFYRKESKRSKSIPKKSRQVWQ